MACLISSGFVLNAQQKKAVLFLGNSYTNYNNLPQMLADLALSLGDTVVFNSNTPGGYTLEGHSTNATSQTLISQGYWDYVILQDQSQRPSLPDTLVSKLCIPYSVQLSQQIRAANPAGTIMFYMTWGRKNGDASNCSWWPIVCTYGGMQSILRKNYLLMADTNMAQVSPVGAVWRDIRKNAPGIDLYAFDGSHPSLAGTYLAACTFYTSIFHRSPAGGFFPQAIDANVAALIQDQAYKTAFDSLLVWGITTNLHNNEKSSSFMILYPNPVNDHLNVSYTGLAAGPFSYRIINSLGMVMKTGFSDRNIVVDNLRDGVYILQIEMEGEVLQEVFVKGKD